MINNINKEQWNKKKLKTTRKTTRMKKRDIRLVDAIYIYVLFVVCGVGCCMK